MASIEPGARAFLYPRVSKDELKRGRSSAQQIAEGRQAAEGFQVASLRIYDQDNNKSASSFGKKVRTDWLRLMKDLANGEADLVIFWEISRGSRTTGEGLAFVDTCAEQSVLVHIINEDSTYDPRKPGDRKRLLNMFTDAEFESRQTSVRIKRDKTHLRAAGRPDGPIPFGHRRLYDERTRELIRQEPDPVEREVIREGVKRIKTGQSLRRVLVDFNKRNLHDRDCPRWVPTIHEGKPWTSSTLRRVLTNRAHVSERRDPETGEWIKGGWDPLFEDEAWENEFWGCYRILSDPSRRSSKTSQAERLLSYTMTCGVCGRRMAGFKPKHPTQAHRYSCRDDPRTVPSSEVGPGCTSIVVDWADEYVTELVVKRLAEPEVIAASGATDDADAVAARARAVALQEKLDEFWKSAMRTDGGITLAKYEQAAAEIEPQIEAAKRDAETAAAPPLLREFLSLTEGAGEAVVRRVWKNQLTLEAQREIIKLLCEHIRLLPKGKGRSTFSMEKMAERIDLKWRTW